MISPYPLKIATTWFGHRQLPGGVLAHRDAVLDRPQVAYLRGGDDNILVEYGEMELDLGLRMRVHALSQALAARRLLPITTDSQLD